MTWSSTLFFVSAGESSDLLRPPLPRIIASRSRDSHNAQGWRIFIGPAAFSAQAVGMSRYVSSFPARALSCGATGQTLTGRRMYQTEAKMR
jgi:hypothetical protein